jgi:hypothetical protein
VVFGSFVTAKEEPNDVDVFIIMEDSFDPALLTHESQRLFDHTAAQAQFGASVLWFRRLGCFEGEQAAVDYWQVKRGGGFARHYRDHRGEAMITHDQELEATQERIRHFQAQVVHLRKVETNPLPYRLSVSGFLAEIDRMQLEVRDYLALHPSELVACA